MSGARSPSPSPSSGRSIDIELGSHEVITIELDSLDPNPDDLLELLREGQCKVWIWTRLASEYWRRGYVDQAERIARTAIECECTRIFNGSVNLTWPNSISGERSSRILTTGIRVTGKYSNSTRQQGTKTHLTGCA